MDVNELLSNCSSFLLANQTALKDMFVKCVGQLCSNMPCPKDFYTAAKYYCPTLPIICLPDEVIDGSQLYEMLQGQSASGSNIWIYMLTGIVVIITLFIYCIVRRNKQKSNDTKADRQHTRLPSGPIVNTISKTFHQKPVSTASDNFPRLMKASDIENQPTFDPASSGLRSHAFYVEEDEDLEIKCTTPLGRFRYFK